MPIEIKTALIGIIASLLGGWAGASISRKSATDILKKQQIFTAASKFKSSILYELIGFYPVDQNWNKNDFHRLFDSIPRINSAAAEFWYFVPGKTDFDGAIKQYNTYCQKERYIDPGLEEMYPSASREKTHGEQKAEFGNIVNHLLSFADEK